MPPPKLPSHSGANSHLSGYLRERQSVLFQMANSLPDLILEMSKQKGPTLIKQMGLSHYGQSSQAIDSTLMLASLLWLLFINPRPHQGSYNQRY
jgi:hypothetical protein